MIAWELSALFRWAPPSWASDAFSLAQSAVLAGDTGRLLQGAGSAFAFTGAVYLAAHGFSARYLATAIGFTQCVGMLGGSAGQFAVGPMIEHGLEVHAIWIGLGVIILAVAARLYLATPKEQWHIKRKAKALLRS